MVMDVIMPQLGETVSEGKVSVWHAKVGDEVSTKTPLFDVSSDKVEMEVPAPAEGTLLEIRIEAGATVPVGEVVAIIGKLPGLHSERFEHLASACPHRGYTKRNNRHVCIGSCISMSQHTNKQ